jgi:hypothetical protein
MADPGFWNSQEKAQATLSEVKSLRNWVDPFDKLAGRMDSALELDELLQDGSEPEMERELDAEIARLQEEVESFQVRSLLRGPDDFRFAQLEISAGAQLFVQCFLKLGGALGQLLSYLRNILFEALFDLFAKELLEGPVAKAFCVLRRMVGDYVGHESTGEPFRALIGVFREEWIERTSRAAVTGRWGRRRWGRLSAWRRRGASAARNEGWRRRRKGRRRRRGERRNSGRGCELR